MTASIGITVYPNDASDPETLARRLAEPLELAEGVVARHDGFVTARAADALTAAFGIPALHEDDALRAVRAVCELRDELAEAGIPVRIGVNTGEVVAGGGEALVTGDAVNVAARLEQAAQPGEILLGEETLRLVRGAVEVEPVAPVEAKGKSEPLAAYKLVGVDQESLARAHIGPMVGRERQRHVLEESFANVVADRTCHLFTVLGTAGFG